MFLPECEQKQNEFGWFSDWSNAKKTNIRPTFTKYIVNMYTIVSLL